MKSFKTASSKLASVLHKIAIRANQPIELVDICLNWKNIIGSPLMARAYAFKYEHGILFIGVDNSVWLTHIALLKNEIINKIKLVTKIEVKDIKIIIKSNKGYF